MPMCRICRKHKALYEFPDTSPTEAGVCVPCGAGLVPRAEGYGLRRIPDPPFEPPANVAPLAGTTLWRSNRQRIPTSYESEVEEAYAQAAAVFERSSARRSNTATMAEKSSPGSIRIPQEIGGAIEAHGGWPAAFQGGDGAE